MPSYAFDWTIYLRALWFRSLRDGSFIFSQSLLPDLVCSCSALATKKNYVMKEKTKYYFSNTNNAV